MGGVILGTAADQAAAVASEIYRMDYITLGVFPGNGIPDFSGILAGPHTLLIFTALHLMQLYLCASTHLIIIYS